MVYIYGFIGGRGIEREVSLDVKHGVEAKNYESVSYHCSLPATSGLKLDQL